MYNMLCLCCSFIINFFYNVYSSLLQIIAGYIGGEWLIHIRDLLGRQGLAIIVNFLLFFHLCFCFLFSDVLCPLFWATRTWQLLCLLVFCFFVFFFSGPFNQDLLVYRNYCVCSVKLYIFISDHCSVDFFEKGRVF